MPATKNGCKDATTDHEQIDRWWRGEPRSNIGIATGTTVDVLDLDSAEAIQAVADMGPLDGPQSKTGKGRHVFFAATGTKNRAGMLPGVDWRGEGGYVVAPPSVHPSGALYAWEVEPGAAELQEPPERLAELVSKKAERPKADRPKPQASEGNRYGVIALEEECTNVATAAEGTRNDTLNRAAFSLGQLVASGDLDEGTVIGRLLDAADRAGLPSEEAKRTLASGYKSGRDTPRVPRSAVEDVLALVGGDSGSGAVREAPVASGLDKANAMLGLTGEQRITRFTREMTEAAGFGIHGAKGVGRLSPDRLTRADAIRGAVLKATGAVVTDLKGHARWLDVLAALNEGVEEVDLGEEATAVGRAKGWVSGYFAVNRTAEDMEESHGLLPRLVDGYAYISTKGMLTWVSQTEYVSTAEVGRVLGAISGASKQTLHIRTTDGRRSTATFWKLPASEIWMDI